MSKSDFIPTADNDLLIWIDHFLAMLAPKPGDYGLSEQDVEQLKAAAADYHSKVNRANDAQAAAKRATAEKKNVREQLEKICRRSARQIKARPDYTEGLGAALGIVGPEDTFDLATAKPDLAATDQTGGMVVLTFSKYKSDGINIYCQREGDTDWVLLGRATVSPFVDNRPLLVAGKPEIRRYTAVYMRKDQEVGQFSDELAITCAP